MFPCLTSLTLTLRSRTFPCLRSLTCRCRSLRSSLTPMRGLTCRQSLLSRQEMMFRRWASCGIASWPASTMTAEWAVERAPLNSSLSEPRSRHRCGHRTAARRLQGPWPSLYSPGAEACGVGAYLRNSRQGHCRQTRCRRPGPTLVGSGDPTRRRSNPDPDGPRGSLRTIRWDRGSQTRGRPGKAQCPSIEPGPAPRAIRGSEEAVPRQMMGRAE